MRSLLCLLAVLLGPALSLHAQIILVTNGNQLTVSFRNNAADVFTEFQKSGTLLPDSWTTMIEGVDYNVSDTTILGGQTLQSLDLLVTEPKHFFREVFSDVAP